MIDFLKTKKDIEDEMLSRVTDRIDKREGSLIQTAIAPVAWYLEGLAMSLNQLQAATSPTTAVGEDLDMYVALRGLIRAPAVKAVRQGTFNAEIPTGSVFATINGNNSVNFVSGNLISHSGSLWTYEMTCQEAGEIGNAYTGDMIPVSAIAGLTIATLGSIITRGAEEESDTRLRERFFDTFNILPYAGNIADYKKSITGFPGVGAVQIYPVWNGGGTVKCVILDGSLNPADEGLIKSVQKYICPDLTNEGFGVAPVGAVVTITTASEVNIDISATIYGSFDSDSVKSAVSKYIDEVKASWGKETITSEISYTQRIFISRISSAILSVEGVTNVTGISINGSTLDISLTENATTHELPKMGAMSITEG